jgi:hypothetical protein
MTSITDWNPLFPVVPLIIAGMIILAALLYVEWQRKQRFRTLRIVCQVLIVTSVLGMLLRPSFRFSSASSPVVLLTPGFNARDIDSLLNLHGNLAIISVDDSLTYSRPVKRIEMRDVGTLAASPLWVAGEGLPSYSLPLMAVDFHFLPPGPSPDGVVALNYPTHVIAGSRQAIAITYQNSGGGSRTIRLTGPGGIEDSAKVQGPGEVGLTFEFTPRVDGRTMYKLEEADSAGSVFRVSRLPVYIEEMKALNVLIVTDHPSFEVRYLKNFLADRGHRVAFRSRVSKERYHQEFANRPRESLNSLTSPLLTSTDLLLLDHGTYLSLPSAERDRIHKSADEGLGLILLAPGPTTNGRLLAFRQTSGTDTVRVTAATAGFVLPVTGSAPVGEVASVVTSNNGKIVSGCRCDGGLKIGYQLLKETYQLGLQNKTASYAALWTPLIDKVSRTRPTGFNISLDPSFPIFSDVPTEVKVIAANATPTVMYDSLLLPLAEDARIDGVWRSRLWAAGNRWHSLTADSTTVHFFDLPETEWKALRVARQIRANRSYSGRSETQPAAETRKPASLAFFILFMIASGTLWLIPKI